MALNPIACEHCRAKKCKCDRRLPYCSQCRASSLTCRYTEGGKRGIPAAYINSLEDRLAETEAALYSALATIHSMQTNGDSGLTLLDVSAPNPLLRDRSKVEKQDEWKRLPLQTQEQLQTWYEEKSPPNYQMRHRLNTSSSLIGRPQTVPHVEHAQRSNEAAYEAPMESASAFDTPSLHEAADISSSNQLQDSAHWRNYF